MIGLYLRRAESLDLASFACDWVQPGASHEQGVDACIEGVLGHLSFVPELNRHDVAKRLVLSWGHLGREDEVIAPEVRAPLPVEAKWPFPTPGDRR